MVMVILLYCLVLQIVGSLALPSDAASNLSRALLAASDINLRPGLNIPGKMNISILFFMNTLEEINERRGYVKFLGHIRAMWRDDRMTWNETENDNVSELTFLNTQVWIPPIVINNPEEETFDFSLARSDVRYTSGGLAAWMAGGVAKTSCFIDVFLYPFDSHTCTITVNGRGGSSTDYLFIQDGSNIQIDDLGNREWDVLNTWTSTYFKYGVSFASFHFRIRRKPQFFVLNMILPLEVLSLLNTAVFLLPASSGERVSFAVTILLAFSVFLTIVTDTFPRLSDPVPVICYFLFILLFYSTLIAIATVLNLRIFNKDEKEIVPTWLQRLVRTIRNPCILSSKVSNIDVIQVEPTELQDVKVDSKDVAVAKQQLERTLNPVTWQDVSRCFDNLFFIGFFLWNVFMIIFVFVKLTAGNDKN